MRDYCPRFLVPLKKLRRRSAVKVTALEASGSMQVMIPSHLSVSLFFSLFLNFWSL